MKINFKQFLTELVQSKRALDAIASKYGKDAKIGFEIECFTDKNSSLLDEPEEVDEIDTDTLDLDNGDQYFHLRARDYNTFEDWVYKRQEEEKQDYQNDNPEATEREIEDYIDMHHSYFTFKAYCEDKFDGIEEYWRSHSPRYGWCNSRETSVFAAEPNYGEINHYETRMNIMRALNNSFGFDVAVGSPAGYHKWYIDTDSSISADASDLEGTEIISPPMRLEEALSTLEKVFEWMQRFDLMTNSTTGFHINVSLPDIEKLDKLKAVLFFGETNALKLFDREASTYAKKHLSQPLTTDGVDIGGDFDILVAELNKRIDESKYRTLNFGKLKDGYLEVRVAGGRDYEKDFDKIKSFILRIVSVLDVACNPAAERQEYMKKLIKTFDISAKLDTEMQVAADQDFGMMIGNFVPSTAGASSYKLIMQHAGSYADEPLDERVLWASRAMFRPLHTFLEANGKHGLSMLSPKHIAQIKNVLKVMKLTDIRAAVKELDQSNRSDSSLKPEILDRITYVLDKLNIK